MEGMSKNIYNILRNGYNILLYCTIIYSLITIFCAYYQNIEHVRQGVLASQKGGGAYELCYI